MRKNGLQRLHPYVTNQNVNLHLLKARYGDIGLEKYSEKELDGVNDLSARLIQSGGFAQQDRMIRDKRMALNKALKYSYQAALVKKVIPDDVEVMDGERDKPPVRALINANKLKFDYDDKIISIGFEHGFNSGDVFEWCNTNTYWIIYGQELTELAYFRAGIRRCTQRIKFLDENKIEHTVFAAVRGPVETRIDFIQKHGLYVDTPNHSLHILMPKNSATMHYFQRYAKFYLTDADSPDNKTCWRVEATDSFSTPGILEINAVEYFANEQEDDVAAGLVGALISEPIDPTPVSKEAIVFIDGETFIKPKMEYIYTVGRKLKFKWEVTEGAPVKLQPYEDENGFTCVKVKWMSTYSGQFDLIIGNHKKTIVVESLF